MASDIFKPTILITGANGQLGMEFRSISAIFPQFNFLFASRNELAIENKDELARYFDAHQIDYCINCAAYTAVDKAESDQENAFLINGNAVGDLAEICKKHRSHFIHISTDYVYDGQKSKPLKEEDAVNPKNVYGWSKLKGEELAFSRNATTLIIRTSWVYSSFGSNFIKTMLRLFRQKTEINVVSDQLGSPTYAGDLASAIMELVTNMENGATYSGIYNYSNSGITTWYDLAVAIRDLTHLSCKIHPVPTSAYPTPAVRPKYSVMDTSKIQSVLNDKIPEWQQSLKKCLSKIENEQLIN